MDDDLKARVCAAIDQRRDELTAFAQAVAEQPELGFFETRTAQRFSRALADLGVAHETGLALTGVKAVLAGGAPAPRSRCWASWTRCRYAATRWPTRRPAPRTRAATTRSSRWSSGWRAACWRAARCRTWPGGWR